MLIGKSGDEHAVLLREPDPNIIEAVFIGEIGMREMEYLDRLSEILRSSRRRRSFLCDTRRVTGFSHAIVGAHAGFSNQHREHLEKIAVVSHLTSVRFAVATAALWQRVPIQWFGSRQMALSWLRG